MLFGKKDVLFGIFMYFFARNNVIIGQENRHGGAHMEQHFIGFYFDLIVNLLEFFTYIKYFNYHFQPKKEKNTYLYSYPIFVLFLLLISAFSVPFFLPLVIFAHFLFNRFTYKLTFKINIFHIARFNFYYYLIYSMLILIDLLIFDTIFKINNNVYQSLKAVILAAIVFVLFSFMYSNKKILHKNIKNPYKKFIYFLLLLIFTILCSFVFISMGLNTKKETVQSITLLAFLLSITMIVLLISIYDKIIDFLQEAALRQLKLQKYELNQSFYDELSEKTQQLSSLKHDFKNHLTIISGWLNQKKYKELHDYLGSIMDYVDLSSDIVITKNQTISSILHAKKSQCDRLGIRLEYNLEFEEIYKISDMDLIIMLGNILDNAIEATSKTAEKDRYVSLTMEQSKSYLIVSCQNSFKEKPIEKNGILITTKKEKNIHGIGLSNIIETCKKYNGEYKYQYDETMFQIQLLLPNY